MSIFLIIALIFIVFVFIGKIQNKPTTTTNNELQAKNFDSGNQNITLISTGRNKIGVLKEIREITGYGLKEAKDLYDKKVYSKSVMTGIGYKELYEYFDGNISLAEAKDLIKKNTRHYAKRQMTWFRNKMDIKWFKLNNNNYQEMLKEVENYIEKD